MPTRMLPALPTCSIRHTAQGQGVGRMGHRGECVVRIDVSSHGYLACLRSRGRQRADRLGSRQGRMSTVIGAPASLCFRARPSVGPPAAGASPSFRGSTSPPGVSRLGSRFMPTTSRPRWRDYRTAAAGRQGPTCTPMRIIRVTEFWRIGSHHWDSATMGGRRSGVGVEGPTR
jgi:hypothetical protein